MVYPSFYEGFGFQALEAMTIGTPVVASQLTSLPEVVGDTGLLVNPYDPNSIADALKSILRDSVLRERLIAKGVERSQIFNWKKTAQIILNNLH